MLLLNANFYLSIRKATDIIVTKGSERPNPPISVKDFGLGAKLDPAVSKLLASVLVQKHTLALQ